MLLELLEIRADLSILQPEQQTMAG